MIGDVWNSLKAAPGQGDGLMRRLILPGGAVDVFAAVRKPRNVPMLIVEAPTEALPPDFKVPEACGFSTTIIAIQAGSKGCVSLELELLESEGEPVFVALVDDILLRVASVGTARQAMLELSLALGRWNTFFRSHGYRGLSRQAQQGLFGELLFLREILAPASSTTVALQAWMGPTGANQDFEYSGHAFEVKTTSANPLNAIRVSNLRQLDDECVESLNVVVFEVERHENADGTLPEAVEKTRQLVLRTAPHLAFDLADRLAEYGYLDQHANHYASVGYGVRAVRAFTVREGFPRVVEADVPVGVGDVRYAVAMSAIGDFELAEGELSLLIGEWLSELG